MENLTPKLEELPALIPKTEIGLGDIFVLLGCKDRETIQIASYCKRLSIPHAWATHKGVPVTPENAYTADPVLCVPGKLLLLVECECREYFGNEVIIREIDHHRPRNRGYHLSAEFFYEASSLGQFLTFLGLDPTMDDLYIAARDHCLSDAMKGRCPGMNPQEVERFGQKSIAEEKGVLPIHVMERMTELGKLIETSPEVIIGGQVTIDFRHTPTGLANSLDDLIAKQILANRGQAGLISSRNHVDGPEKIMLCGATPEAIIDFQVSWGKNQKLHDFFFVTARRYVGGFMER